MRFGKFPLFFAILLAGNEDYDVRLVVVGLLFTTYFALKYFKGRCVKMLQGLEMGFIWAKCCRRCREREYDMGANGGGVAGNVA
jgi:hypothetical protein